MSLPWFKVYSNLPRHPKARALGEALNNPMAWGHIVALWSYCCEFVPSGVISSRDRRATVEREAHWSGEKGAFYEAAIATGWIEERDDSVVVHGWEEVQSAHFAKAERDKEAAKKSRKTKKKETSGASLKNRATKERRDGDESASKAPKTEREKETERETKKEPSAAGAAVDGPDKQLIPDRDDYVARFRALFGSPHAEFTKGQAINFAKLRKKHGMPLLIRALEGLAARSFDRKNRTLGFVCSSDGVDLGTREPGLPGLDVNARWEAGDDGGLT